MSYRIYRTDALVLKSYPSREADRTLVLYTEDFGLVYAHAQGVRHERSKLRYALCDLSLARVALVRGKAGWRVTGAVAAPAQVADRQALVALARIAVLVTRLVQGEDQNAYLFHTLHAAHGRLIGGGDAALVEVAAVSRILHALGYIAPKPADAFMFAEDAFAPASLEMLARDLPQHLRRINDTLAETQL